MDAKRKILKRKQDLSRKTVNGLNEFSKDNDTDNRKDLDLPPEADNANESSDIESNSVTETNNADINWDLNSVESDELSFEEDDSDADACDDSDADASDDSDADASDETDADAPDDSDADTPDDPDVDTFDDSNVDASDDSNEDASDGDEMGGSNEDQVETSGSKGLDDESNDSDNNGDESDKNESNDSDDKDESDTHDNSEREHISKDEEIGETRVESLKVPFNPIICQSKFNKKYMTKNNQEKRVTRSLVASTIPKIDTNDEYNDTSDEEDIRNTVGNVPMHWYDEYPHLGYDWSGKKILKPEKGDALDNFLKRMEDPNFWRTVKDPQTGQDVVLCDADVDLIKRIQSQKIPDVEFEEYGPWIEWFTSEVMKTPLRNFPEHKRSFLPSRSEKEKVSKIVHAIKMGWIKPRGKAARYKSRKPKFYMLWQTDDSAEEMRRIHNHIPAPNRLLPGHAESYNPPPEFLFDKKEMEDWIKHTETPWKRKLHYVPKKYDSLRQVPAYDRYVTERFSRCLDLYLCPRARKMRLTIEPEDLVPQLPSPKELQPFPTVLALVYKGHTDMVRSISIEPKGQYLVSGSDDFTVKIWEVSTARCVRTIPVGGVVRSVSWCPNQALCLVAVAADRKVLLINPGVGDHLLCSKTDSLLEEAPKDDTIVTARVKAAVQWEQPDGQELENGIRIIINHFKEVKQVTWHGRGDYFATVMPEGLNRSILMHQLSKRRSQVPFSKNKGLVQCVMFHPVRPVFFVATQRNIRVYDLVKQVLIKKLLSNSKWISSMAIHPGGDNILVGTYDRKMLWFDLDLSTQPYQALRLHGTAVRGVAFHKQYPLFASGSDDSGVIICHGMVYNDLLQNALIVPLKRLSYHETTRDFGVFDVVFHPTQPWVFSSGGDKTIRMCS